MADTLKNMCNFEGCEKRASFGVKGAKDSIKCVLHREKNHANISNKICAHAGCLMKPYFNVKGAKTGVFCGSHKEKDHIDVRRPMRVVCAS